jgi:glycogen(starch) synthase
MVVPSVMEEPFGIVALEGLACGCRMVISKAGGLPEAVGRFARIFRNGDVAELSAALRYELVRNRSDEEDRNIKAYLSNFSPNATAKKFLTLLGTERS